MAVRDLLSLEAVRTVVAVAEHGSFSKAAERLGVSQPSISQHVRKIEEQIGRRLFQRSAHRLAMTSDGEAFLVFAKAMLDIGEAARRHFVQARTRGSLRLGVLEGVARTLLIRFLGLFSKQFPDFALEIGVDAGPRLFADLDAGKYDIVLSASPPGRPRGDLLRSFQLVWIGQMNLAVPVSDPVPLVLPPAPEGLRDVAFRVLGEAGRTWRIAVESTSLSAVEAAVGAGLGVSLMVPQVKLYETVILDASSGLPALPARDLVIDRRSSPDDEGIDALCSLLRSAFLQAIESTG